MTCRPCEIRRNGRCIMRMAPRSGCVPVITMASSSIFLKEKQFRLSLRQEVPAGATLPEGFSAHSIDAPMRGLSAKANLHHAIGLG